ncbi:MAG: hypothetical protein ACI4EN_07225 [Butyrivibrio sp.]
MNILRGTKFKLGNLEVFSYNDINLDNKDTGYFILNMWTQCEEENPGIIPVEYVRCSCGQELQVLKKDNIIMGVPSDICLN